MSPKKRKSVHESYKIWRKKNPNWHKEYYKKHPDKYQEKLRKSREWHAIWRANLSPAEKKKSYEYQKVRYHTDSKYRARVLKSKAEWQKRHNYFMNRYHSDPEFKARVLAINLNYQRRMRAEKNQRFLAVQRKNVKPALRKVRFRYKFERLGYSQEEILAAQRLIDFNHNRYHLSLITNFKDIPKFLRKD